MLNHQLERRIRSYLRDRGVPEWGLIKITPEQGVVVLQGRVSSTNSWRLCLESCRRVAGVLRVVDELEVLQDPDSVQSALLMTGQF